MQQRHHEGSGVRASQSVFVISFNYPARLKHTGLFFRFTGKSG